MSTHIKLSGTEMDELIRLRNQRDLLIKESKALRISRDEYKKRALIAESQLAPTRESLNKLTAEKSKWMRKNKS